MGQIDGVLDWDSPLSGIFSSEFAEHEKVMPTLCLVTP